METPIKGCSAQDAAPQRLRKQDLPSLVYSLDFDVHSHQLRHTCITNLISAQVDPKTVQYLAGHKKQQDHDGHLCQGGIQSA
jgi:integrase